MKIPKAIDGDPDPRTSGWRQALDTALTVLAAVLVAGAVLALVAFAVTL